MPIVRTPAGAARYNKPIGSQYSEGADRSNQSRLQGRAVERRQAASGSSRSAAVKALADGPVPDNLTPAQQVALYRERLEKQKNAKQRNGARRGQAALRKVLARRKRSAADEKRIARVLGVRLSADGALATVLTAESTD